MEPIDKQEINNTIHKSISDQDLEHYFSPAVEQKVIVFGDFKKYNSIDELLPNSKDYAIVLIETSKNVGHWCCITKDNNVITWFDSYGYKYGAELKFVDADKRKLLNEDKNYLANLLKQSKYKIQYNKIHYQNDSPDVKDCGRYVILYIILFKEKGFNLKQFQNFMKEQTKRLKLTSDQLVSYLVK